MDVTVTPLPAYRVAYLRHIGYGEGIAQTWQALHAWSEQQGFQGQRRHMFGISHDNPRETPIEQCRYDACVEVDDTLSLSGDIGIQHIPAGTYACAAFRGTPEDIGPVWERLFTEWLPTSAYTFTPGPCFEHYPADIDCTPEPGIFVCNICIPVTPR